jgi:hypothetical protein
MAADYDRLFFCRGALIDPTRIRPLFGKHLFTEA